ncbi:hypothetical protein MP638_003359 [Amoeboaphelidium occidentale]|nr:hypothetical protein MP638_003359 [Amoeboaphelidium occidentale]
MQILTISALFCLILALSEVGTVDISTHTYDKVKASMLNPHHWFLEAMKVVYGKDEREHVRSILFFRDNWFSVVPLPSIETFFIDIETKWDEFMKDFGIESQPHVTKENSDGFEIAKYAINRFYGEKDKAFQDIATAYIKMIMKVLIYDNANQMMRLELRQNVQQELNDLFNMDSIEGTLYIYQLLHDTRTSVSSFVGREPFSVEDEVEQIFKALLDYRQAPFVTMASFYLQFELKLQKMIAKRQAQVARRRLPDLSLGTILYK